MNELDFGYLLNNNPYVAKQNVIIVNCGLVYVLTTIVSKLNKVSLNNQPLI